MSKNVLNNINDYSSDDFEYQSHVKIYSWNKTKNVFENK